MSVDTSWFSVFRAMFRQGTVAKIGVYAWTVYTCIKAHADFHDGLAIPSRKQLSEETGLSERQVQRALKILEREGILTKSKEWKRNVYHLKEKIIFEDAIVTWDYLPAALKKARQELQNFLLTGDAKDAKIIHVEHLTVTVIQGDQHNVTINQLDLEKIADPLLREKMKNLLSKVSRDQ